MILFICISIRIDWVKKISLTVKCKFDFSLFPNDEQTCDITPYLARLDKNKQDIVAYQMIVPLDSYVITTHEIVETSSAP
jgi:hypothetical protein